METGHVLRTSKYIWKAMSGIHEYQQMHVFPKTYKYKRGMTIPLFNEKIYQKETYTGTYSDLCTHHGEPSVSLQGLAKYKSDFDAGGKLSPITAHWYGKDHSVQMSCDSPYPPSLYEDGANLLTTSVGVTGHYIITHGWEVTCKKSSVDI